MDSNNGPPHRRRRTGKAVVGVILRQDQFLLIRRSKIVAAPGFVCFAGGGVEEGESEHDALVREMQEELAIDIVPHQRLWHSVTRWGTELNWWLINADADLTPVPNPDEVEEIFWLTRKEISARRDLLGSMPEFLAAWQQGLFTLPTLY